MSMIESQWWAIEFPEEWNADQDEEMIVISDQDDVGEISITTLEKESGLVDDDELKAFIADLEEEGGVAESVEVSDMLGYYFSYDEEGDAIREWYLRYDNLLLLITYCCDAENKGMDDSSVDEILSTMVFKIKDN